MSRSNNKATNKRSAGAKSTSSAKNRRPLPQPPSRPRLEVQRVARGLFARTEGRDTADSTPVSKAQQPPAPTASTAQAKPAISPQVTRRPTPPVAEARVATPTEIVKARPIVPSPQSLSSGVSPTLNVPQLRESFSSQAPSRAQWVEADYVSLIRRLDTLQTEAFILKGKLLSETKDRFYAENKRGWIDFCETSLGLNYTTANQYIRVAVECDVMSHQYPSLGFEHFKALLPLAAEHRPDILASFGGGSVKSLRQLVSESQLRAAGSMASRPGAQASPSQRDGAQKAARNLLRNLQAVHTCLDAVDLDNLPTRLAWQVSVACGQVASHLMRTARAAALSHDAEGIDDDLPSGATGLRSSRLESQP